MRLPRREPLVLLLASLCVGAAGLFSGSRTEVTPDVAPSELGRQTSDDSENDLPALDLESIRALSRSGDFELAAKHCEKALSERSGPPLSFEDVDLFNVCGSTFQSSRRSTSASELLAQALAGARWLEYAHGEASASSRLALHYKYEGQLARSLELNRKALEAFESLGDEASVAVCHHNLGSLLLELGRPEEALDSLQRALSIRRRLGDLRGQGSTLTRQATVQARLGRDRDAYDSYLEAFDLRRSAGDLRGQAVTRDQLARLQMRLGELDAARESFEQARNTFETVGDYGSLVNTLSNLGRVLLAQQRPDLAEVPLLEALDRLSTIEDQGAEAHVLVGLAQVDRALGRMHLARRRIESALEVVERVREQTPLGQTRSAYFATTFSYYEEYIDLLLDIDRPPESELLAAAFLASERARARTLVDLLNHQAQFAATQPASPGDPGLEALRRQIAEVAAELFGHPSRASEDARRALNQKLRQLLFEIDLRRRGVGLGSPDNRLSGSRTAPDPLPSLAEAQHLLDSETAFLVYFLGDHSSYLWLVESDSTEVFELEGRETIERVALDLRRLLKRSPQAQVGPDQIRLVARELASRIFPPIGEKIRGKRLVILPHGALHYVPFAILPSPATSEPAPAEESLPLVRRHEILHTPSVAALASLRARSRNRQPSAGTLVVVAGPWEGSGAATPGAPPSPLPGLPAVTRETAGILDLVAAEERLLLAGPRATKSSILHADLGGYRILHLATHGLLQDEFPLLSALALPGSEPDRPQEPPELLYLFEVFDLDLPSELVVLSACETALGELVRGEGMIGMAHGFFVAGATRVLVSLWKVDDEATAALMVEFYRGLLREGLRPAAALRRAQTRMSLHPRWHPPYFWAGFVLQGDWL